MERRALILKARQHWEEWFPKKTQDLKEIGEFKAATRSAARRAQGEIANLLAQGHGEHEAEEVVLPKHILLEPEPGIRPMSGVRLPLAV